MEEALLDKYTKTYGIRFSKGQKKRFIKSLKEDFSQIGYESTCIQGKKLLSKSNNYLFGNMKQVKTILVVPYDTPEKKFWNKVVYYPFNGTKTASKTLAATYVPILIFFVLIFGGIYGLQPMLTNSELSIFVSLLLVALTLFLMFWMMHGLGNRKNYNRNSATIATAVSIAKRLTKDERRKIGFLFTDKNKMRFPGAEACAKDFASAGKNPSLVVLDCIGNGSITQIAYNPQNRKIAMEIAKYYPVKNKSPEAIKLSEDMRMQSAMSFFKKAVVVASGDFDKDGNLSVMGTGTGKDTVVQKDTLHNNEEMVYTFLHNQK